MTPQQSTNPLINKLRRELNPVVCPKCSSKNTSKAGKRKTRTGDVQLYQCKDCRKYFTKRTIQHVSYSSKHLLAALSLYNRGYNQTETIDMMRKRYKISIPQATLSNWIHKYSTLLTFTPMRNKYTIDPEELIFSKKEALLISALKRLLKITSQQALVLLKSPLVNLLALTTFN